jgi:lipid-A-disaccharide synthase
VNGGGSTNPKQIMVIAGEVSGDLHAAGLVTAFKALDPDAHFFGVGGTKMAEAGCENLYSVDEVAFLGFTEVIRHIPFIRNMMQRLLRECIKRKPHAVILVDYPGFNLRLAERLKRSSETRPIPILYYISPQVWAWHKSRISKISRLVDKMAVIFDFEVPLYREAGLAVEFVGHPLLEVTRTTQTRPEFREALKIPAEGRLLALLPGSRIQEVRRLLPLFLDTYNKLVQRIPDLRAAVGCSPALDISFYQAILKRRGSDTNRIRLLQNQTSNLQAHSDAALVASGTATLETAILGTPMVMAYKVAPLTYTIGRLMVKIPNIALVNVVAGEKVVPEFIQGGATPEHISDALYILLTSSLHRDKMKSNLERVRRKLGQPGASGRVAEILTTLIQEGSDVAA